jgi:hypothetical protein
VSPERQGRGTPAGATRPDVGGYEQHSDITPSRRPGIRVSRLDTVEIVARAIYGAHWKSSAPRWEQASTQVREWVRVQARAAIAALRVANGT